MRTRICLILSAVAVGAAACSQVVLNQIDTFQDSSTMGWSGGSNPSNISNGGPLGAGDRYLQIEATSGFLASFNIAQWSGNYLAAGVNRIEADLRNTGPNPLAIRLIVFQSTSDRWSSVQVANLPANSAWTHVSYDLVESNFVHTIGAGTFTQAMTNMNRLMFRHEPNITSGGTAVTGQLGIDNVAAYAEVTHIVPTSFNIDFGFFVSGVLADLQTSNDSRLAVRQTPFRSRLDPAVRVLTTATAPPGSFDNLELTVEASSDAVVVSDATQTIEVFNFNTSSWVQVDSRPCTSADQTVILNISSNVNHYINPANRQMAARVNVTDPGTLLTRNWGLRIDFVRWTLSR